MKTLLIETLEKLGYDVIQQGTLADDAPIPDSFITFLTVDCQDNTHFDNEPSTFQWRFQVAFYSINPLLVASVPVEIRNMLKNAGFIPIGKGRDLPSAIDTHTGWVSDYYYLET